MLNEEEWGRVCENTAHCPVYYDPLLRRSKTMYEDLIRKMHQGGLVTFTRRPLCRAGAFCVKNKTVG